MKNFEDVLCALRYENEMMIEMLKWNDDWNVNME